MDGILLNKINKKEEELGIIQHEQEGFREGHSTERQVMGMIEDVVTNFRSTNYSK